VRAAAAELADAAGAPVELALRFLPWLLGAAPAAARGVLAARVDLPSAQVLALLEGARPQGIGGLGLCRAVLSVLGSLSRPAIPFHPTPLVPGCGGDLRWQYLQHVVHARGTPDAALHTDLGTSLAAAAAGALGELRRAAGEAAAEAEAAAAAAAATAAAQEAAQGGESEPAAAADAEAAADGGGGSGGVPSLEEVLDAITERLPVLYAPNSASPPGDAAGGDGVRAWGRTGSHGERRPGASQSLASWDDHAGPFASPDPLLGRGPGAAARRRRGGRGHAHAAALGGAELPKARAAAAAAAAAAAVAAAAAAASTSGQEGDAPGQAATAAPAGTAGHAASGALVGLRPLPPLPGAGAPGGSSSGGSGGSGELLERLRGPYGAAARRALELRSALALHLQASVLYDPQVGGGGCETSREGFSQGRGAG
jgi:hypothetical protein